MMIRRDIRMKIAPGRRLRDWFSSLSLTAQFLLAGGLVMLVAMLVSGVWITRRIEAAVVQNTASATALYVKSFLSAPSQELDDSDVLSPAARAALNNTLSATAFRDRIVSTKLWKRGGLVAYSTNSVIEGERFDPPPELKAAWSGKVVATLEALHDNESVREAALGIPLLEVYAPIRAAGSGEIIAVAEFYEVATELTGDLLEARLLSWMLIVLVFGGSALALTGIVRAGANTIASQEAQLRAQVDESRRAAALNAALRERVVRAATRATAMSERTLRRIGADLHDGPAQYVALAAMRLDSIAAGGPSSREEAAAIGTALQAALTEIRAISRGLSLPDLEDLALSEIVERAVDPYRHRPGASVAVAIEGRVETAAHGLSFPARTCMFRFLQEALSNATRHAPGSAIRVSVSVEPSVVRAMVGDDGPGFDPEQAANLRPDGGEGLAGLRDRAESLGAQLDIVAAPGRGTRLVLTLPTGTSERSDPPGCPDRATP